MGKDAQRSSREEAMQALQSQKQEAAMKRKRNDQQVEEKLGRKQHQEHTSRKKPRLSNARWLCSPAAASVGKALNSA